jgi:predicted Zn-dependent protease
LIFRHILRKGSFGCLFNWCANWFVKRRAMLLRILGVPALFTLLASCATNPVTGDSNFVLMSEAQELQVGRAADQDVKKQYALYDENGLAAYVSEVGQRVASLSHRPGLAYRFTLLDSTEINAFALPGGFIYVTRGIVAFLNSEAELAAVLGHEVGHVTARHSVRQMSAAQSTDILFTIASVFSPALRNQGVQNIGGLVGGALLSGYGRDHELEADRLGAEYLARTGYDPQAMIRVIGVLKNQELFDAETARQEGRKPRAYHGVFETHPDNDTRLQQTISASNGLRAGARGDGRDEFLKRTAGMIFGDSPREGIVRAGSFYHPDLGIALKLPRDWRVQNLPDRLAMLAPGGDTVLEMRMVPKPGAEPIAVLRSNKQVGNDIETTPVNGLPAAFATGRAAAAGVVYFGDNMMVFNATAKSATLNAAHARDVRDTIRSFHRISDSERGLARPLRLRTVTATETTRFAALAAGSPLGRNAEGTLRLINGIYPAGEPRPGQLLKVID